MLKPDPSAPDYEKELKRWKEDPGSWGPDRLLENGPTPAPVQAPQQGGKK